MADQGYRVLARKYRPSTFDDLIGQHALVKTLTNAFAQGRIAQAYMLTGVRGVGKTTTARIVARGLNYEPMNGDKGAPTVEMPELGKHCEAIMESRHVDVIEMDAASHTGIDDIRDIIESVQYRPASARYKVFIIDEVHMLSKAAFNGLLKTLEEPPSHVKFIFATTEIRKVPVTVLSRCQRFDLRRVPQDLLMAHLTRITTLEGKTLEAEAAAAIARAAEGSVRDALSLLDQAIAQGAYANTSSIDAPSVQAMLGLADQGRVIDLFAAVSNGQPREALDILSSLYDVGADPLVVLKDLASLCHQITRHKVAPEATSQAGLDEASIKACAHFSAALSMPVLSRFWQMLVKGIDEVEQSSMTLAAAEMVLLRLCYVSDVPTPDDLVKLIEKGGAPASSSASPRSGGSAPQASGPSGSGSALRAVASNPSFAAPAAAPSSPPKMQFQNLAEIVAVIRSKRDMKLAVDVETFVEPVSLKPGILELRLAAGAPVELVKQLGNLLSEHLGQRFTVVLLGQVEGAVKSLAFEAKTARISRVEDAHKHPLVLEVKKAFPKANVLDVHRGDQVLNVGLDSATVPEPDAESEDDAERGDGF